MYMSCQNQCQSKMRQICVYLLIHLALYLYIIFTCINIYKLDVFFCAALFPIVYGGVYFVFKLHINGKRWGCALRARMKYR